MALKLARQKNLSLFSPFSNFLLLSLFFYPSRSNHKGDEAGNKNKLRTIEVVIVHIIQLATAIVLEYCIKSSVKHQNSTSCVLSELFLTLTNEMPRIHEGKKKRGIFFLSTPFQQSHDGFTFEDDDQRLPEAARTNVPDRQPAAQHAAQYQRHNTGPALHVAPRKENMNIEIPEYEGGMSQLTLEGETQFYTGAVDDDLRSSGGTMDNNCGGDKEEEADGSDAASKTNIAQELKKQEMNDGLDDDSVTTIGDNANDEGSVDLLQEDSLSPGTSESKPKTLQDDLAAARNGVVLSNSDKRTPSKNKCKRPPELSPATQTLDRLDALGSQQGGAELSLNLLKWANGTGDLRKNDDDVDDAKSDYISPEKTVVGSQVETNRDALGGVSFRLLSEAAERKSALESSELLDIAGEKPNKGEVTALVQNNVGQQFIPPRPQRDCQPPAQFVARPSLQGVGVEEGDRAFLQDGGLKSSKVGDPKLSKAAPANDDSDSDSSFEDSSIGKSKKSSKSPVEQTYTKELQSISADLAKRQCLHELKEYFMSTQNSSSYARKHQNSDDHPAPPRVPFCIACKNPATQLPHHGLCPKHADFFNSGSYEILNLLVDGNILKCEACSFHFDNGRPNKQLPHATGCGKGGGGKKKAAKNTTDSDNAVPRSTLEDAAASGCSKCQNELATGVKTRHAHNADCPRKPKNNKKVSSSEPWYHSVSLEDAAASGCSKCQHELATGMKTARSHNNSCPRRRSKKKDPSERQSASLKHATTSGCKKCQRELATGLASSFSHSKDCPFINDDATSEDETISLSNDARSKKFEVGTLVYVKSRTWPGMNKLGGVARITKVHLPTGNTVNDCVKYDVAYVIESRREKLVEERFVTVHTDYVSPTKDQSLVRITEDMDLSESEYERINQEKEVQLQSLESTPIRNGGSASNVQTESLLTSAEKKDEDGNPLSDCKCC